VARWITALVVAVTGAVFVAASPAVAAAGNLAFAAGDNLSGQLGNGGNSDSTVPVPVSLSGTGLASIGAGETHSLGVTATGQVRAWGNGTDGQLGNGTNASSNVPVAVSLPPATTITAVAGGALHSLALTSTGQVLAWGNGSDGQLGNGTNASSNVPVAVSLPPATTITAIAAGTVHSLALTSTGQVLAWGDNAGGQLGDGTTNPSNVPVAVSLPPGTTITAIAAGNIHSLAVTSTGAVLAWGFNADGELGDGGNTNSDVPVATMLPTGTAVTAVSGGAGHSLAVTTTGQVLAWGANGQGQLGNGTNSPTNIAVTLVLPAGATATAVDAGLYFSLALTSTGQLLAWGSNGDGEFGNGTTSDSKVPVSTTLPAGSTATAIAAGGFHSLALLLPMSTTTLSTSPPNPAFGQALTLTATVGCNVTTPTGTVSFTDGATTLGTATLSGGPPRTATLTVPGLAPGSHTLSAHYNGDANCPQSTSTPATVTVGCVTLSGVQPGLTITQPTCLAPGTQVNGTVTVTGAGALATNGATINGSLVAAGGTGLRICGTTISGTLSVSAINGVVIIGESDGGGPTCTGNTITSGVTLQGNVGFLEFDGNTTPGTAVVTSNSRTIAVPPENATTTEVESNHIGGPLVCSGNTPPPTNDGHPNTVTGPRIGQCSTL
jgi:alpha-tubulin suppressor-like RCC1 family protein